MFLFCYNPRLYIMNTRKTKIVATMGPASENPPVLEKMINAGLNVARLNFSHREHKAHEETIKSIRAASQKTGVPIAIMQDLSGPKIRTGDLAEGRLTLEEGKRIILTTKPCPGTAHSLYINYKHLPKEIKKGDRILLDDGKKRLDVISTDGKTEIICKIIVGGEIMPRRGVNVPDASLSISSITAKDKKDILFGVKHGVDFMALSFVRQASDIVHLRKILTSKKADIGIIAKIETQDAIKNLDEIIAAADAVMVARGDLAVEAPPEEVPLLQKRIVKKCNRAGKPVIIATQMLESMIHSPVATRAEVSDVANSILDGADAIMLSAETAIGAYPVRAIEVMSHVARATEHGYPHREVLAEAGNRLQETSGSVGISDAVAHSGVNTAYDVGAAAIVALTESGFTARAVARYHPQQPIVVMSPNQRTLRRIILSYGCYPVAIKPFTYVGEAIERIKKEIISQGFAKKGDKIVIAAGVPFRKRGGTNMVIVHEI
jgi:pyruvate kinase